MTQFAIQFMMIIGFFLLGVSYLMHGQLWLSWLKSIVKSKNQGTPLMFGAFHLLFGSFILAFHWVWEGYALIITLIGVICLVRAVLCFVFPKEVMKMVLKLEPHFPAFLRYGGVVLIIIAALIAHENHMLIEQFSLFV